jgi:hypothetical protein
MPQRDDDSAGHVGELGREASQLVGLGAGGVVVDADPAVPRRRDDARFGADDPRDPACDGFLDGAEVIGLEMDRAHGCELAALQAQAERVEIGEQGSPVVGEAEPAPVRERLVIRQLDVQGYVAHTLISRST